ncbi:MAG: hypothetical protein LBS57_12025 [Treponema sp.]|nr:hypothetical protein [Treponema sp.]
MTACSPKGAGTAAFSGQDPAPEGSPPRRERFALWQSVAILETGENPLWFELQSGGPVLINSPGEASLSAFTPWPHARNVTGLLPWEGGLVLGVNRDGFLVLSPDTAGTSGRVLLSRSAEPSVWENYTSASPFMLEGRPAALIYRSNFFLENNFPPPAYRIAALDKESAVPLGVSLPGTDQFPPDWELDSFRPGADGFWYYRAAPLLEKAGKAQAEYYRTESPLRAGEKISLGAWRNSLEMERAASGPAILAAALARVETPGIVGAKAAAVISPQFSGVRVYLDESSPGGRDGALQVVSGYYSQDPSLALVVFPKGQGSWGKSGPDGGISLGDFSLPALPEGFSYTGAGLAGTVLAASWEEQEDSAVGAAGFMVMDAGAIIP